MHLKTENLITVLKALSTGLSIKQAMATIGAGPTIFYGWVATSTTMKKTNVETPPLFADFGEAYGGPMHFADAVRRARAMAIMSLDSEVMAEAHGQGKPRYDGAGKPIYKHDMQVAADALSMDDDTWWLKYGQRPRTDTYMRDANGALVQEREPMPGALKSKVLAGLIPRTYGDHVRHTVDGAVTVRNITVGTKPSIPIELATEIANQEKQKALAHFADPTRQTEPIPGLASPEIKRDVDPMADATERPVYGDGRERTGVGDTGRTVIDAATGAVGHRVTSDAPNRPTRFGRV